MTSYAGMNIFEKARHILDNGFIRKVEVHGKGHVFLVVDPDSKNEHCVSYIKEGGITKCSCDCSQSTLKSNSLCAHKLSTGAWLVLTKGKGTKLK